MTHQGGNVESPCPFLSIRCTESRSYFLGTPASSARAWVTASQKISSTFSLDRPDHLDLRHPGQFPAHHRGLGQRVAGPPLLADGEGGNRTRSIAIFAFSHRCEAYHCGNYFLIMDILASNF